MTNKTIDFKSVHTEKKRKFLQVELTKVANTIHKNFPSSDKVDICSCCGSRKIDFFVKKFGYEMNICKECGHIFTNPFPSNAALDFYYNSDFKKFENEFFIQSFDARIPIFTGRLELMKQLNIGKKVLDVGSAVGIFIEANMRGDFEFDITACDLSEDACTYLISRYPELKVLNCDIENLEPAFFDAVTLWDTFEHIPNPKKLLEAISRQLKPSGYFLFSTPNTKSFEWSVMREDHVQLLPPGHVNLYNKDNIEIVLNNNNFSIESIETLNPSLDLTYIRSVVEGIGSNRSTRAAKELLELLTNEDLFERTLETMRDKKMAGNMLVVAKKNE